MPSPSSPGGSPTPNSSSSAVSILPTGISSSSHLAELPGRPRISFTGHADPAQYDHHLHAARLAVQLRSATNGESSGTLAETTAVGLPTIVTDIGAQTEFDDRAVLKVDIDVPAPQLADAIGDLLTTDRRAADLARSGLEHARRNSYEAAARRLTEVLAVTSAGRLTGAVVIRRRCAR